MVMVDQHRCFSARLHRSDPVPWSIGAAEPQRGFIYPRKRDRREKACGLVGEPFVDTRTLLGNAREGDSMSWELRYRK
jgi:hypothetical protein